MKPIIPLVPKFGSSFNLKIIGLGGVGSIVADYSTLWLIDQAARQPDANFRICLIDGDAFEPHNHRMFFNQLGPKAQVRRDDLMGRLGDRLSRLTLVAINEYVTDANVGRLIHEGDVVMLCVDSHAARKLISDHFANHVNNGVLISAGNDGVGNDSAGKARRGTFGNCQLYIRRDGRDATPSLTRHHPEIARPADKLATEQSCTDLVASVPQLLWANAWAAMTAMSTLYLTLCGEQAMTYNEVVFDLAEGKAVPMTLPV